MQSTKMFSVLLVVVFAGVASNSLSGCSSTWDRGYRGAVFLPPATYVSTAFISSRGDVFLVPKKDSVIEGVTMPNGAPVPWKVDGSYIVLPAESVNAMQWVNLKIDGRMRQQWLRNFR